MSWRAGLALGLVACARPAPPTVTSEPTPVTEPAVWRAVSAETSAITDLAELQRLAADFPNSATVQRRLLSSAFAAGDVVVATAALDRLEAMAYTLQPDSYAALAPLVGERARPELAPITASTVLTEVPAKVRLAEGIAVGPDGTRFVGSVVERGLFREVDAGWERVPVDTGSVFGLTVDAERGWLWLASGAVEPTPKPDTAFVGLVALSLPALTEVARVPAPDGVRALNDLTVAPDGDVLAADSMGGGLYRLERDATSLERLPTGLRGPQGVAAHPSGRWAYWADYGYGIAVLDLETREAFRLVAPESVALDGTDGLLWHEGTLLAIQNGVRPMRITRLTLDADGRTVTRADTLERAHPEWGEPTLGVIVEDALVYVSRPQWERFGPGGAVDGEPLANPLRRLPLP
ncbi:MAG: hypothetical protein EP330_14925 [Deltaproteobacteria bacterium]|nr:MAG: hypothetical protein EP330_14925 [Deltaproteobacteria bacterium]